MNISLSQQVESYIQTQVHRGRYVSTDEALSDILKAGVQALQKKVIADSPKTERRKVAYHLHEIEGNPLTDKEKALFEAFDLENLTAEQRIRYLTEKLKDRTLFAELS